MDDQALNEIYQFLALMFLAPYIVSVPIAVVWGLVAAMFDAQS